MKKKKKLAIEEVLKVCKICKVGSCCYEGAELTKQEMKKIIHYNPRIPKPWFRLVRNHEEPDGIHLFSTIERNGTCIFQDKDNRCLIYDVRPRICRHFPMEDGRKALYCERLCVVFYDRWPRNRVKRNYYQREKK